MTDPAPDTSPPELGLEELARLSRSLLAGCPQTAALQLELVDLQPARAVLALPWAPGLVGDPATGVIAGGAVTSLLDQACGQAVWAALGRFRSIATLDLRIDYLRPARPERRVVGEADCYRVTRSVAFVRALAHDGDRAEPVAAAQAVFMLDSDGGRRAGANRRTPRAAEEPAS